MLHDQTQQVNCAGNFRVLVKSFAWQCHDRDGACLLCHHRRPNTKQKEFLSINCYGCNQIQLTHPPVQRTNLAQHLVAKNTTHGYMNKSSLSCTGQCGLSSHRVSTQHLRLFCCYYAPVRAPKSWPFRQAPLHQRMAFNKSHKTTTMVMAIDSTAGSQQDKVNAERYYCYFQTNT